MNEIVKACPTHELELRFIPEGISKAGNRYNAFYGCPEKLCKYSENIPEKKGHFLRMQGEHRRAKEIAYGGSANRAIEIGAKSKAEFEEMFNYFMEHWQVWYVKNVLNEED